MNWSILFAFCTVILGAFSIIMIVVICRQMDHMDDLEMKIKMLEEELK